MSNNNSAAVDLDNPTPKQRAKAIAQLRGKLSSEISNYCTDLDIWRFAVARQLDTDKAAAMINGWHQWRKEARIDALPVAQADNRYPVPYPVRGYNSVADANLTAGPQIEDYQLRLNRYFGGGCWHKRDNDGHPVYIERVGRYKIKDLSKKCPVEELLEYHYLMQEFLTRTILPECSDQEGREISQQVVIFDLAGLSIGMLSHLPALNMLRDMLVKDQLYYPERMYRTYVINAPNMFVTAWKLIKGWLDPRVIGKTQILGKGYRDELLKQIPAENLPSFLGGQCRCSHMAGGCVPSVPLRNLPDFPRNAFTKLARKVEVTHSSPHHSFAYNVGPADDDSPTPPNGGSNSTPQSPLMSYASALFGLKKDTVSPTTSEFDSALSRPASPRHRYVYVRFMADRGRGMVVEALWRPYETISADVGLFDLSEEGEILVYPETLLDPQRAPVVLELKLPNRSGQLVVNWRIANLDEGLSPYPTAEEAEMPVVLEYSVDREEDLVTELGLSNLMHE